MPTSRAGRRSGARRGSGTYTPSTPASARAPRRARARPGRAPGPGRQHLVDLAHDLFAVAQDERVDEVGQRLGVERAVAAGQHQRVGPVRSAPRTASPGQVDQVEHVGVDELGREVEGQHVEGAGRAGGSPPRTAGRRPPAWPPPCRSTGRRCAPPGRRAGRSGSRRGSADPGWAARSRRCRGRPAATPPARPRARASRALLAADVAGGLLDRAQQGFDPRPERVHAAAVYDGAPPASAAGRRPVRQPLGAPPVGGARGGGRRSGAWSRASWWWWSACPPAGVVGRRASTAGWPASAGSPGRPGWSPGS